MSVLFSKLYRYGRELNTHDLIKIIATLLMIVDHVGEYLFHDNPWCRLLGRGAAPLFFFLIGYTGKLHLRTALIVFGFILTFTMYYVTKQFNISILFNFILIHYCLQFFPPEKIKTTLRITLFIFFALINIPLYYVLEYGSLGILLSYSARLVALKDRQSDAWLTTTMILYFLWESLYFRFITNPYTISAFALLTFILIFIMSFYRLRQIPSFGFLRLPCLFISRYSLEIYFFHLIALQAYFFFYGYL